MDLIEAGCRLDDDRTYLHEWIRDTSPEPAEEPSSEQLRNVDDDEHLVVRFHACCLRALHKIFQQLSAIDPERLEKLGLPIKTRVLSEELGRLYLWGEGFASVKAGKALERADELRNSILEVLCGIGSLLVYGKHTVANARLSGTSITPWNFPRLPPDNKKNKELHLFQDNRLDSGKTGAGLIDICLWHMPMKVCWWLTVNRYTKADSQPNFRPPSDRPRRWSKLGLLHRPIKGPDRSRL